MYLVNKSKYFLLSLCLLLLTSSCGFHLRGQGSTDLAGDFVGAQIYLAVTSQDKNFFQQLTRDLQLAGFSLVDEPEDTNYHLVVLNTKAIKRMIGTDRNGRDNEFSISQTAEFIINGTDKIKLKKEPRQSKNESKNESKNDEAFEYDKQTVRASRTYYFDNNDPIGKKTEEDLLKESMRRELSRKVISHLVVSLSKTRKSTISE